MFYCVYGLMSEIKNYYYYYYHYRTMINKNELKNEGISLIASIK